MVAVATAASAYAGVSLLIGHGGGLYVALPAALAEIANNVGGAWSLLMSTEEGEAAEIGG